MSALEFRSDRTAAASPSTTKRVALAVLAAALVLGPASAQASSGPKPSTASPAPAAPAPTAESFEKEWQSLLGRSKRGEWKGLKAKLETLIAGHEGASYVRVKKEDVVLLHRNAAFREKQSPPDPRTLISGKLLAWEPLSGRLKVEYTPQTMADWVEEGTVHPAGFRGPHSVEVHVKKYPYAGSEGKVPMIGVCADGQSLLMMCFGLKPQNKGDMTYSYPTSLRRHVGKDEPASLADYEGYPCEPGEPVVLKLVVEERAVTAYTAGKKLLSAPKKQDEWGAVVVIGFPRFEKITLEGKAEASWIQGLIDAKEGEARAAFDEAYDPEKAGLPSWLFSAAPKAPAKASGGDDVGAARADDLPDLLTATQRTLVLGVVATEDDQAAVKKIRALADADLPPATRATLLGERWLALESYPAAIESFRLALKSAPDALRPRTGLAQALLENGDFAEAAEAADAVVQKAPAAARPQVLLVQALFLGGKVAEAKSALERATLAGVKSSILRELGPLLAKAAHGPEFAKRERVLTDHYEIDTDLDRFLAAEAGKALEESYLAYTQLFGRPKTRGAAKARVFLFAGEEGYKRYAEGVTGGAPMHTAGLYSPVLKQLLIWNLPTRAMMIRTVRHEGLHQFLDRLWRDPPVWLNEGLAEYCETIRLDNGAWKRGEVRKDHLEKLAQTKPLRHFLTFGPGDFYMDAEANYAQGWAFAHFLLHGGPESKKLWDALTAKLAAGASAEHASESVFPAEDMEKLEVRFLSHLRSL